jgi:membrane associated rhomboid family serine protease
VDTLFYIVNALVLPPAFSFAGNFYRYRGKQINYRQLPVSKIIIGVTALVTVLQFIFPVIVGALDRNKEALLSGEVWRLITPLFVQPLGIWQCVFNGVFLLMFMPVAEHFYGRRLILIYFTAGIAGQIANFYWNKGGGGSSTAIYGVMGALSVYVLLNLRSFPKGYILLGIAPLVGAIALYFYSDGHASGLLVGAVVALIVYKKAAQPYKMTALTSES